MNVPHPELVGVRALMAEFGYGPVVNENVADQLLGPYGPLTRTRQ